MSLGIKVYNFKQMFNKCKTFADAVELDNRLMVIDIPDDHSLITKCRDNVNLIVLDHLFRINENAPKMFSRAAFPDLAEDVEANPWHYASLYLTTGQVIKIKERYKKGVKVLIYRDPRVESIMKSKDQNWSDVSYQVIEVFSKLFTRISMMEVYEYFAMRFGEPVDVKNYRDIGYMIQYPAIAEVNEVRSGSVTTDPVKFLPTVVIPTNTGEKSLSVGFAAKSVSCDNRIFCFKIEGEEDGEKVKAKRIIHIQSHVAGLNLETIADSMVKSASTITTLTAKAMITNIDQNLEIMIYWKAAQTQDQFIEFCKRKQLKQVLTLWDALANVTWDLHPDRNDGNYSLRHTTQIQEAAGDMLSVPAFRVEDYLDALKWVFKRWGDLMDPEVRSLDQSAFSLADFAISVRYEITVEVDKRTNNEHSDSPADPEEIAEIWFEEWLNNEKPDPKIERESIRLEAEDGRTVAHCLYKATSPDFPADGIPINRIEGMQEFIINILQYPPGFEPGVAFLSFVGFEKYKDKTITFLADWETPTDQYNPEPEDKETPTSED